MADRSTPPRVLVLAYGNPGRLDDGLGPAVAEALEPLVARDRVAGDRVAADRAAEDPVLGVPGLGSVTIENDYQLQLEDAAQIAAHDVVVFVDATVSGPAPFSFRRIEPAFDLSFTSHSVSPEALLDLATEHLGAETEAYVLAVRGYEFDEFGERLSVDATRNLRAAVDFLVSSLKKRSFHEVLAGDAAASPCQPTV